MEQVILRRIYDYSLNAYIKDAIQEFEIKPIKGSKHTFGPECRKKLTVPSRYLGDEDLLNLALYYLYYSNLNEKTRITSALNYAREVIRRDPYNKIAWFTLFITLVENQEGALPKYGERKDCPFEGLYKGKGKQIKRNDPYRTALMRISLKKCQGDILLEEIGSLIWGNLSLMDEDLIAAIKAFKHASNVSSSPLKHGHRIQAIYKDMGMENAVIFYQNKNSYWNYSTYVA